MDDGSRDTPAIPTSTLSAVSHELRGPLGVARGYLRLLALRTDLDERATKAVTEAGRATDRMAELLDTLADFIRCARGDTPLTRQPLPLVRVLDRAATMTTLPEGSMAKVESEADSRIVVTADEARLAAALSTLAATVAFAAGAEERGTLVLRGTDTPASIAVVVSTGTAATVEVRPFAPLRSGGGLALPLAELIVRLHGGVVEEQWSGDTWRGYVVRLPVAPLV